MKKIIPLLLSCLFILSACNKESKITCKLISDGLGVNDKSYNASAWEGILSFYGDSVGDEKYFGTLYDSTVCNNINQYDLVLRQVSEENLDVIVLISFSFQHALDKVAKDYPKQKYITIDGSPSINPNVHNYLFAAEEGSYLVGVCAAAQAIQEDVQNPKFGFIGGVKGDALEDFEIGYAMGIRSLLPDAKICVKYIGSWGRPDLAAKKASEWYNSGVYAIYSAAGMSGNGAIAQAVSQRISGKNVWAIGVDKDQYSEGAYGTGKSAVLTSMIKRVDVAVIEGLKSVQNGTFKPDSSVLTLKEGSVGFTTSNPDLKDEVIKLAYKKQAEIISGRFSVPANYKNKEEAQNIHKSLNIEEE